MKFCAKERNFKDFTFTIIKFYGTAAFYRLSAQIFQIYLKGKANGRECCKQGVKKNIYASLVPFNNKK